MAFSFRLLIRRGLQRPFCFASSLSIALKAPFPYKRGIVERTEGPQNKLFFVKFRDNDAVNDTLSVCAERKKQNQKNYLIQYWARLHISEVKRFSTLLNVMLFHTQRMLPFIRRSISGMR